VVLKIADGIYAYYAHLQKGSEGVRVEPGERVSKGQVVGKLGNTGNTDAPHLHFMLIDGKAPLTSHALPFKIGSFRTQGLLNNFR
jgi:murein DD-endopeptidase MepM/ murein hydrolase activator NlpD